MFSRTTEHLMRVAVFLADHGERLRRIEEVAQQTRLGLREVMAALETMVEAGLAAAPQGPSDGYRLAREPGKITMFDIVQCTAPIERISECPLKLEGHGPNLCPLHRRMDNAMLAMEQALRRTTIAQLLVEPTESRPLCNFPRHTPLP
jgi:Rrf2 family transcriptional regulator, nitric oxide-sensitive transcriptional repressor